jgi:U6 snRNA-associated Sm-like protein LSm8
VTDSLHIFAATVSVITNDGRQFVGTLRGFDQAVNLILDECHERVYKPDGIESEALGLYVIRGDNV